MTNGTTELIATIYSRLKEAMDSKRDPTAKDLNKYLAKVKKHSQIFEGAIERLKQGEVPECELNALKTIFEKYNQFNRKEGALQIFLGIPEYNKKNRHAYTLAQTKRALAEPDYDRERLQRETKEYKTTNFPKVAKLLDLHKKPNIHQSFNSFVHRNKGTHSNLARIALTYTALTERLENWDRFREKPIIETDLYDAMKKTRKRETNKEFNYSFFHLLSYGDERLNRVLNTMEKFGLDVEDTGFSKLKIAEEDMYDACLKESQYFTIEEKSLDEYARDEKQVSSKPIPLQKFREGSCRVSPDTMDESFTILSSYLNSEPIDYFCCMQNDDPNIKAARQRAYPAFMASINQSPETLENKLNLIHESQVDITCLPSRILTYSFDKIKERIKKYQ